MTYKKNANEHKVYVRFKNQGLARLRNAMLRDSSRECFAVLLAKRQQAGHVTVFTVVESVFPASDLYNDRSLSHLQVHEDFIKYILTEIYERVDVDTIIQCHTHPFSEKDAWFSPTDDQDDSKFAAYLHEVTGNAIHFLSIVFSQKEYKARYMGKANSRIVSIPALIRTQKVSEQIKSPDDMEDSPEIGEMFQRSVLALGLDNMRKMVYGQKVSIIGVGGLGSIIAEQLIHMGIRTVNLIDYDKVELTNLNRLIGVSYQDAKKKRLKVECVREHLLRINPQAKVNAYPLNVCEPTLEPVIAESNWLFIATDNQASRYHVQSLAFKYYVPFISAGVGIHVKDDAIVDMRGEVILVRMGDSVCSRCLGRVNFDEIAFEEHPDSAVREQLVAKGYVRGRDVKEPAVITLNTHTATLAADVFINQFTERQKDNIITVFEDNFRPRICLDMDSVKRKKQRCGICDI